jgi:hypothetical protein
VDYFEEIITLANGINIREYHRANQKWEIQRN